MKMSNTALVTAMWGVTTKTTIMIMTEKIMNRKDMIMMVKMLSSNESRSWSLNLGIGQIVVGDKILH